MLPNPSEVSFLVDTVKDNSWLLSSSFTGIYYFIFKAANWHHLWYQPLICTKYAYLGIYYGIYLAYDDILAIIYYLAAYERNLPFCAYKGMAKATRPTAAPALHVGPVFGWSNIDKGAAWRGVLCLPSSNFGPSWTKKNLNALNKTRV
jgi:hypothetical protein